MILTVKITPFQAESGGDGSYFLLNHRECLPFLPSGSGHGHSSTTGCQSGRPSANTSKLVSSSGSSKSEL